ncbi:MAG: LegC family aminotransferase [Bacillota bacterium]
MKKTIPLSVPNFVGNELKYVTEAIKDEWVSTGGEYINEFEKKISNYLKVRKAVACQNGTSGLHLSLKVAGVKEGNEVIVPTVTFIAAVNPVKYLNAEPIFMDCDKSLNMDLNKLQEFINQKCIFKNEKLINKKSNKHIKAIVVVHIFGNLMNMEKVMEIANRYNLKVIEDATEALGSYYKKGKYKEKFAGTIGDFGVYSFNGNKIITTGGGGMIVANNDEDLERIKYLSTQAKDNKLYYKHDEIGYNYRMTNLQAALGVAQLENLEKFINIKKTNYHLFEKELIKIKGLNLLKFNNDIRPNYWFYSVLVDSEKLGLDRNKLIKELGKNNIQTRPLWSLIHNQKPYKECQSYKISKAEIYEKNIINIPCSTKLDLDDINYIIKKLKNLNKK